MGDREVSYFCLKKLIENDMMPVLFLFPKSGKNNKFIDKVKSEYNDIPFIHGTTFRNDCNLQKIKDLNADYIISILFPYIFKKPIFNYTNIGIINLHPSYLPYCRGWNPASWCILENTPIGATLHWVDEGIDTGDICFQKELEIKPNYTADIIYKKISDLEKDLFVESIENIKNNTLPRFKQSNIKFSEHCKTDLDKVKEIDINNNEVNNLINKLRALTTNDIKEAAFFYKNNKKYYLTVNITEDSN